MVIPGCPLAGGGALGWKWSTRPGDSDEVACCGKGWEWFTGWIAGGWATTFIARSELSTGGALPEGGWEPEFNEVFCPAEVIKLGDPICEISAGWFEGELGALGDEPEVELAGDFAIVVPVFEPVEGAEAWNSEPLAGGAALKPAGGAEAEDFVTGGAEAKDGCELPAGADGFTLAGGA